MTTSQVSLISLRRELSLKAKELLILPTCPFFSGYLKKHPEYADQVHPTYRAMLGL